MIDWVLLLGTERPPAYLQSCTLDEFLDLACGRFGLSREALVARAGLDLAPRPEMTEQRNVLTGQSLGVVASAATFADLPGVWRAIILTPVRPYVARCAT